MFEANSQSGPLHVSIKGMQPGQRLLLQFWFVHEAAERRSSIEYLCIILRPRLRLEHRPQCVLDACLLFPCGVFWQGSEQGQHHGLAVRVAVVQNFDDLSYQSRIGRSRCIEVENPPLAASANRASPASLSVLPAFSTSIFIGSSAPLRQARSASSNSGPELLKK